MVLLLGSDGVVDAVVVNLDTKLITFHMKLIVSSIKLIALN